MPADKKKKKKKISLPDRIRQQRVNRVARGLVILASMTERDSDTTYDDLDGEDQEAIDRAADSLVSVVDALFEPLVPPSGAIGE
jgi:hypothetical protein